MSGVYSHLTGQQIRVLKLHPGAFHDDICISLLPHDLEDGEANEPYEAVSYVWGEPALTKLIRCNEHNISVTENVHELLSYLRIPDASRRLWIDAICIDQDSDERSKQVSMMQQIYRDASQVLIWFGPDDRDTAALIRLLRRIHEEPYNVGKLSPWALLDKRQKPGILIAQISNTGYANIFRGRKMAEWEIGIVQRFAANPWFHRAWTFQEACLASSAKAICGNFCFPWTHVLAVVRRLATEGCLQAIFGSAADSMIALSHYSTPIAQSSGGKLEILNVLRLLRNRKATDDRDKVFSVLGLSYADTDLGISPDYRDSPTEVYIHCARTILGRQGNLALLSCCIWPSKSPRREPYGPGWWPIEDTTHKSDLPSWVPDWRIQRHSAGLRRFPLTMDQEWFEKLGNYYNSHHISDSIVTKDNTLRQRGAFLGTISSATSTDKLSDFLNTRKGFFESDSFQNELFMLLVSLSLGRIYNPTGESVRMALMRTLAANRLPKPVDMQDFVQQVAENAYHGLRDLFSDVGKLLNEVSHNSESSCRTKEFIDQLDAHGKLEDYESAIGFCYHALEYTWLEKGKQCLPSTGRTFFWDWSECRDAYINNKEDEVRIAAKWMATLLSYLRPTSEENQDSGSNMQVLRDFLIAFDLSYTPVKRYHTLDRYGGKALIARYLIFGQIISCPKVDGLRSAMGTFAAFRNVFKMENGWIGLGPDYMNEGDEVWDLNGAEVPFILRREAPGEQKSGERRYRLVGECYVHGVTKGEPWWDVVDQSEFSLRSEDERVETIDII